MKSLLTALALLLLPGVALSQPATPIDPQRLSDHVKVLASDAFEGRGPATPAETKTIDYIVGQMKTLGLKPAGEKGGWTQDVTLARFQATGPIDISMTYGGQAHKLTQTNEIVVSTSRPIDRVAVDNAPLVFVGYGVTAPEQGWDDFKGLDVKGKMIVVLVNDPDFEAKPGDTAIGKFGGKAMTYYGRWTYKHEEAARRGALGIIIVHETEPASYGWNTVKNSWSGPGFDVVRPDASAAHSLVESWIQRDLAVALFKASGLDFEAEKARARNTAFTPVELKGAALSAHYAVDHTVTVTHNILGKIEGSARPNEIVFYSGHWDHFGIGEPDAKGDKIYNGAIDNADGIAAILEIAREFKKRPAPKRTVLFMAAAAEEQGLLGSEYYATHPLYPLGKTVANINIDALSGSGPARDVSVSGDSKGELQDMLVAEAEKEGRRFTPDSEPGAGHFYRSDHFPFSKQGVPALSIESGMDLYQGGAAAGEAKRKAYVDDRYHQPSDQWDASIDFNGMALDAGLAFKLGNGLANSGRWPGWKPESEFKAERDKTAAERR